MNTIGSLAKLHPQKKIDAILGTKTNNLMEMAGEDIPRKSISIRKEAMAGLSPQEQFEMIVDMIGVIARTNRHEVENALIVTGSPKAVRKYGKGRYYATIQNRLTQDDAKGKEFRDYMTLLVADRFGKALEQDSFFKRGGEQRVGTTGYTDYLTNPWSSNQYGYGSMTLDSGTGGVGSGAGNVTGTQATADGGATQTNNQQDWGGILSGSAQVINSIGGVIGLFTGGNQGTTNTNVFGVKDPGESTGGTTYTPPPAPKNRTGLIIALVVGAVLIGGLIWWLTKKGKAKKAK
jgi:hypothetical protein